MTPFQVVRFLLDRGNRIPSQALLGRIGRAYVAAIDRYAEDNVIPVVRFAKGESQEQGCLSFRRPAPWAARLVRRPDWTEPSRSLGVVNCRSAGVDALPVSRPRRA